MSAMAPADLLLAIGLVCVAVVAGMNVVTAARFIGGKAMSKVRRLRFAVLTVSVAVVGLVCTVAWFAQS